MPKPFSAGLSGAHRRDPRGVVLAVLVHLALLLLATGGAQVALRTAPTTEFLSDGIRRGGGGGGGSLSVYIAPAASPAVVVAPPPVVPPPVPVPAPVTPPLAPPRETPPPEAPAARAASAGDELGAGGPGSGGGAGAGAGSGSGEGVGPGSGSGSGGGSGDGGPVSSPVWRSGALPFEPPPKSLRGKSVRVTFYVRADGRVERLDTDPPISDAEYAARFDETLRSFRFLPARTVTGTAVPANAVLTFQLPSR